ncbi:hypothetical protein Pst134EA_011798 [Puccinia striiformis f. sp. tritici]|uniref:hypothetical protein n=1 Tax=Puccinia striiformis f. sp. tritici TaxID=168172 RepID=UPI002007502E|nr:hypothetical protein Pst134EA_011798 [Puccinia striiformis f. sp. tritici]KAH9468174.1 hypothetical protein Pst134EA_011798 [Puccinia striiformis f. sp. tritici]
MSLLEDLEDRVDQSAWDMIPPYQEREDDEAPVQAPQLARVVNQPLAVGSALLLPSSSGGEPGGQQAYWTESPQPPIDSYDTPVIPIPLLSNNHLRTPANDLYRPTARPTHTPATDHTDLTFGSEDDGGEQDETGPMIE